MPHLHEVRRFEREDLFQDELEEELGNPGYRYYSLSGKASCPAYTGDGEYRTNLSITFCPVVFRRREAKVARAHYILSQIIRDTDKRELGMNLVRERILGLANSLVGAVQGIEMSGELNSSRVIFDTHGPDDCSLGQRRASPASAVRWFASMREGLEKVA